MAEIKRNYANWGIVKRWFFVLLACSVLCSLAPYNWNKSLGNAVKQRVRVRSLYTHAIQDFKRFLNHYILHVHLFYYHLLSNWTRPGRSTQHRSQCDATIVNLYTRIMHSPPSTPPHQTWQRLHAVSILPPADTVKLPEKVILFFIPFSFSNIVT